MSCASKKIVMTEVSEHVESGSSATKTLYFHHHNAYRHETWLGGDLPSGSPTHKFTLIFDHVFLRDHMTN